MATVGKWLAAAVALAIVCALGWMVYSKVAAAMAAEAQGHAYHRGGDAVPVEVAPVERGPIRDVRQFTGTLRPRAQYQLAPRTAGRVERLAVDIGDTVEHGQVIAWMDDQEYVQQVEQARAELQVAQATLQERNSRLQVAQREHQRIERLREQQIASESELDAANSRLETEGAGVRVAEAQVAQRQAALLAAEVRLSYTQIRAAWDDAGARRVVGERFIDAGTTLSANTPIISLLDIDTVIAVINVTERDYVRITTNQQATLRLGPDDELTFPGRVVRMAPLFHEGSRQARVEIELPNAEHQLKPGMFVRVSLELGRADDAVIVPRQAIVLRDGEQGLFLADAQAKSVRFVPVRLGIVERQRVQVLDPPLDGQVVVLGQHLLSNDAAISVPDAQTAERPGTRGAPTAAPVAANGERP